MNIINIIDKIPGPFDIIINNFRANQEKAINIRVDNNLVDKDPHFGFEKHLEIHFELNGEECISVE